MSSDKPDFDAMIPKIQRAAANMARQRKKPVRDVQQNALMAGWKAHLRFDESRGDYQHYVMNCALLSARREANQDQLVRLTHHDGRALSRALSLLKSGATVPDAAEDTGLSERRTRDLMALTGEVWGGDEDTLDAEDLDPETLAALCEWLDSLELWQIRILQDTSPLRVRTQNDVRAKLLQELRDILYT